MDVSTRVRLRGVLARMCIHNVRCMCVLVVIGIVRAYFVHRIHICPPLAGSLYFILHCSSTRTIDGLWTTVES